MPEWTKQQQHAIYANGGNILVSAAAGSGKTAVLVERVIQKITGKNPVDIDKLLVVTFTNLAAGEMKSRIYKALSKKLEDEPGNINLVRQQTLLAGAKICTIDSFCINFVRENSHLLGIRSDFSILNEYDLNVIYNNAFEKIAETKYEQADKHFLSLVETFSTLKNDAKLYEIVLSVYRFTMSQAFFDASIENLKEMYNPTLDIHDTPWFLEIKKEVEDICDYAFSLIDECSKNLEFADELYDKFNTMLDCDRKIFENISNSLDDSWDKCREAVLIASFTRLPSKKNYNSPSSEAIKEIRNTYKALIKDLSALFCVSESEHKSDMEYLYPLVSCLCSFIIEFKNEVQNLCNEENAYSFSDIEHFALDLLAEYKDGEIIRTPLASEIEGQFEEILVDEYQDTNEAQDLLFAMLSNGENLFMVGDVKQSIYRFRLAMPQIFMKKNECFLPYDEEKPEFPAKILLSKNFRSRKEICNYINFVFSHVMSKDAGEVDYNDDEYLYCGAEYDEFQSEPAVVKLIDCAASENSDSAEAYEIASLIKEKIEREEIVEDKNGKRPITYSDFAILLRSEKRHAGKYREVLEEQGIPVDSANKLDLFENSEIILLLSLLRIIDNPSNDIDLLTVMSSALFGFTPDELSQMRINHRNGTFYSCVLNSCNSNAKTSEFLNKIEILRNISISFSVSSFIRYVLRETSFIPIILALGNSEQRKGNINKFISIAKAFDSGKSCGLTAFLKYIDKIISSSGRIESAQSGASNNCVKIMSVHKSKGLEFPVCILAGAARKYNKEDSRAKLLLSNELGIGFKRYDEELLCSYPTLPYVAVKLSIRNATMSENLRVLYVAMTRARESFISLNSYPDVSKKLESLKNKISNGVIHPFVCKKLQSDSEIILLNLLLHKSLYESNVLPSSDSFIELQNYVENSNYDFNISINYVQAVDCVATQQESSTIIEEKSFNDYVFNMLKQRIEYNYPYSELSNISAKSVASELDENELSNDFFASSKPAFLNDDNSTLAEKGSAMHAFMQFCDYQKSKENLMDEIKRLTDSALLNEKQAEILNISALTQFFESNFASRIFSADKIYREIKVFSFVKPDCEIDDDSKVLVQGIADCVFEENGNLILVDYKTDKVKSEQELLDRYKRQIEFYKYAVSKTLKKEVSECYLYSFYLAKSCKYKDF